MRETSRRFYLLLALFAVGAVVFGWGINWGLPSEAANKFLFPPGEAVWSGADLLHWQAKADASSNSLDRGADVSAEPIVNRDRPVTLLENRPFATPDEIAASNPAMKKLMQQRDALEKQLEALQSKPSPEAAVQRAANQLDRVSRDAEKLAFDVNSKVPGLMESKTADDAQRARIIRRYRLFSYQPDEMITFMSLAKMHPAQMDFDPRLYQYGGMWIYPVGAILRGAAAIGQIQPGADLGYYLDHPGEFGRFYIFARAYAALWGLVGVWAIFAIVRKITGGLFLPAVAALCFIFMPVVINMAHEAKPHLPGTVLILLTILAAMKYVETSRAKWAVLAGVLAGLATGMVLSAVVAVLVLPVMVVLARGEPSRRAMIMFAALALAAVAYFATNPYVGYHLLFSRDVLRSNLGNSSAMYHVGHFGGGIVNAVRLIAAGASIPLAIFGLIGAIGLAASVRRPRAEDPETMSNPQDVPTIDRGWVVGWLLLVPSAFVLLQCVAVGAGKPGEFGRFFLLPDIALMIAAVAAVGRFLRTNTAKVIAGVALIVATAGFGWSYEADFVKDASADTSRLSVAEGLETYRQHSAHPPTLGLYDDPAPYNLPPVDLFGWRIVLLPRGYDPKSGDKLADVIVTPDEGWLDLPEGNGNLISWANKRFRVQTINP